VTVRSTDRSHLDHHPPCRSSCPYSASQRKIAKLATQGSRLGFPELLVIDPVEFRSLVLEGRDLVGESFAVLLVLRVEAQALCIASISGASRRQRLGDLVSVGRFHAGGVDVSPQNVQYGQTEGIRLEPAVGDDRVLEREQNGIANTGKDLRTTVSVGVASVL